jgi:DNA-binding response OmpR family regulator
METRASILIVDDEPDLVANLTLALESEGYSVLGAGDGLQALNVLQSQLVDLVLADIAMPHMNGYQFYQRVRENPQWGTIPFIFLTARKMDSDIRYGKEMGVDDYLTKPIRAADLLAVVRGKLRRARHLRQSVSQFAPSSSPGSLLTVGRLRIDSSQYRCWMGEQEVQLSAREFALLEHLAQRAGQVVSHQELIMVTHELDTDAVEAGSLLRPLIRTLRRKLGYGTGHMGCLENVRSVGYRLVEP